MHHDPPGAGGPPSGQCGPLHLPAWPYPCWQCSPLVDPPPPTFHPSLPSIPLSPPYLHFSPPPPGATASSGTPPPPPAPLPANHSGNPLSTPPVPRTSCDFDDVDVDPLCGWQQDHRCHNLPNHTDLLPMAKLGAKASRPARLRITCLCIFNTFFTQGWWGLVPGHRPLPHPRHRARPRLPGLAYSFTRLSMNVRWFATWFTVTPGPALPAPGGLPADGRHPGAPPLPHPPRRRQRRRLHPTPLPPQGLHL